MLIMDTKEEIREVMETEGICAKEAAAVVRERHKARREITVKNARKRREAT